MYTELIDVLKRCYPVTEGEIPHNQWDVMHQFGNAAEALLYVPLFCPEFVEVEGSVLLNRRGTDLEKRFLMAKRAGRHNLSELESSFNFLEVPYAFSNGRYIDAQGDDLLATFVAETWRARLKLLYDARKFEVGVLPPEQTGSVIGVHFFEIRNELSLD
jgi:hypothetical protein